MFASELFGDPIRPRLQAVGGRTLLDDGVEVPLLRFEHVVDAIRRHRHHHLVARLRGENVGVEPQTRLLLPTGSGHRMAGDINGNRRAGVDILT